MSSAREAARAPSMRSNFPPVKPSSYWKPRTIRAKKLSMVPSVIWGSARTTRLKASLKSASGMARSLRNPAATCSSRAASASLVKTESANSPAAFRVKVSATMRSGAAPWATKPMTRLPSWKVLPEPAEARMSRFLARIFISGRHCEWILQRLKPRNLQIGSLG